MNEEDRLLCDLGRLARGEKESEQARLDERWDRLAAGTITAEEEAELKVLAATSAEAREALEAFRPLGADFQARVIEAIAAEMHGTAERKESPRQPRPRPSDTRRDARRWGWWWLVPAAAAAAALLVFVRGPATLPPFPTYTADELTGGIRTMRGGEPSATGERLFVPSSLLTLVALPERSLTEGLEAHGFLARGNELVLWEAEPEIADNGNVRIEGALPHDLEPGEWRVWLVVGRRGRIPPMAEVMAELRGGRTRHDHWQAVSRDFRVEDQGPP